MVAYLAVRLPTFGHPEVTHRQDGCASWNLDQPSGTPRWSDRLEGYGRRKANRRAPRGGVKKSYVMVGSYRVEPNGCRAVCNQDPPVAYLTLQATLGVKEEP